MAATYSKAETDKMLLAGRLTRPAPIRGAAAPLGDGAREAGFAHEYIKASNMSAAIADPASHFDGRAKALDRAGQEADAYYAQRIEFYLKEGLPSNAAEQAARRDTANWGQAKMLEIDALYPSDINNFVARVAKSATNGKTKLPVFSGSGSKKHKKRRN